MTQLLPPSTHSIFKKIVYSLSIITLAACSSITSHKFSATYGKNQVQDRVVAADSESGQHYIKNIQPVLEQRCVVCHACYDAPCQLKLTSPEGIDRGTSKDLVYSGSRLLASSPSRLFVDQPDTFAWRDSGFSPVLNERTQSADTNRALGVMHQALDLKKQHPLPDTTRLDPKEFDLSINRKNECPSDDEYQHFARKNPSHGMPFALPAIADKEHQLLSQWLADGAKMAHQNTVSEDDQKRIEQWEEFLNQNSLHWQLVARYIYEHLFLGNIHFLEEGKNNPQSQYYKLVRSSTAPGQPITIIPTRRPYDDPKVDRVYYRLMPMQQSIVSKTHMPYSLTDKRLAWMKTLFAKPHHEISELPGYSKKFTNPFVTFQAIPAAARYEFMLSEAKYIISGYIKGPVCRGQVAVDVINDHFWVFFVAPRTEAIPPLDEFLKNQAGHLRLPGEQGSNAGIVTNWLKYSRLNSDYLLSKRNALNEIFSKNNALNLDLIWDGDGHNKNAALTVFRNFDNAAVVTGLVGRAPKTSWIIDYPLLERIHYLLTVDFDVYGNIGHQLNTRLYMDFLRIEAEFNFLTLLPKERRLKVRDHWYRDASERVKNHLYQCENYITQSPAIEYTNSMPKIELYQHIKYRLRNVLDHQHSLSKDDIDASQATALKKLQWISGRPATLMAEHSLIYVHSNGQPRRLYTLLSNRAHSNITSLFLESKYRLPEEDTLTIADGVIGDYPNAFFNVDESELSAFVNRIASLRSEQDYQKLLDLYGVRRTNKAFWQFSDTLHETYVNQQTYNAGVMDYNRIENR